MNEDEESAIDPKGSKSKDASSLKQGGIKKQNSTIVYEATSLRGTEHIIKQARHGGWNCWTFAGLFKYIFLSVAIQIAVGQDYAFPDGKPGKLKPLIPEIANIF